MPTLIPTTRACGVCGYELTHVISSPHPEITLGWVPTNRDQAWAEDFGNGHGFHICWPKEET